MSKPTLILDFDETLFDIPNSKRAYYQAVKPFLIKKTRKFYDQCAQETREKTNGIYIYKNHIKEAVSKDNYADALKAYEKVTSQMKKFLFPDALDFVKKHSKILNIIVLSTGLRAYQKQKIKNCGIDKYCQKIIITEKLKHKNVVSIIKKFKAPYLFIDDKGVEIDAVKKDFPEVTCYWMRRPGAQKKYRDMPCKLFDHKITNLKKLCLI